MLCLKVPTDPAWAVEAMRDVDAVLVDHAHCELKAASNALSLAARHPADLELVRALTDLAREEIDHFQQVLALLVARGLTLGPPPVDEYAAELRREIERSSQRSESGTAASRATRVTGDARASRAARPNGAAGEPGTAASNALVDRLLVGALIEARSCERFKLLGEATASDPSQAELHALWTELLASEARHYRTFVDLTVRASGGDREGVLARLDRFATVEGTLVQTIAHRRAGSTRATIHG